MTCLRLTIFIYKTSVTLGVASSVANDVIMIVAGLVTGRSYGDWRHGVTDCTALVMVALCNRSDHYIFILFLSSFFSSPNLSGRRLDVYHTLALGVALVRI